MYKVKSNIVNVKYNNPPQEAAIFSGANIISDKRELENIYLIESRILQYFNSRSVILELCLCVKNYIHSKISAVNFYCNLQLENQVNSL